MLKGLCRGLAVASSLMPLIALAHAPSGAIFTTLVDGSEVNFNHYASKYDVYLDGGPGPGAPASAAGLDPGTYVFQVTDPSGKTLLSTDPAGCRQFTVDASGLITGVVAFGAPDCSHETGVDIDHWATTVQLMPYNDTPNNGGVYKVWAATVEDFLAGCAELGENDGLNVVDCEPATGRRLGGNFHGFLPRHSKTDNFKVGDTPIIEIDTRFLDEASGTFIDGLAVQWTDPVGAGNRKWSYFAPQLQVMHEAHVEGVEKGYHQIQIDDQEGCYVHDVYVTYMTNNGGETNWVQSGPGTVWIEIKQTNKDLTAFIDVDCHTSPIDE